MAPENCESRQTTQTQTQTQTLFITDKTELRLHHIKSVENKRMADDLDELLDHLGCSPVSSPATSKPRDKFHSVKPERYFILACC